MSGMREPPRKVYLDPRVASTLSDTPNEQLKASGVRELCYISIERATELVREAQEKAAAVIAEAVPAEFVVQLMASPGEAAFGGYPTTVALTNRGRLFMYTAPDSWVEVTGPLSKPAADGSA